MLRKSTAIKVYKTFPTDLPIDARNFPTSPSMRFRIWKHRSKYIIDVTSKRNR
jgi:hypothetical protein